MTVLTSDQHSISGSDDLVSKVRSSLGKLSYHQLDDVNCTLESAAHITLSGNLKSYYLKQIAQAIAIKVPGVREVTNEILVME